jgi:signal transduction histidine kinase
LQGIAERVRILGGAHTIHSAPGQGTTVTVRVELKYK